MSLDSDLGSLLSGTVLDVAPRLLGCVVGTNRGGHQVSVRLNEVEAYDGANDPASHAFRGETERTAPMFGVPGTVYVYRSYGIHWCMNIVVKPAGEAGAVLLRGGVVVAGRNEVERRRGRTTDLVNGPGKLCQALSVTCDDSGSLLGSGITLEIGDPISPSAVASSPRIGISQATDRLWRFTTDVTNGQ
ncbi:MAG: DNA-3-methyladenine glycosylase [Acidimicrobiia bacterium]